jgi:ribonuclease G
LLKTVEKMRESENEGFIVRTQAPFATLKQLKTEATYLKKLYAQMLARAKGAPIGTVLYQDETLPMRTMRDSFGEDISAIHVGDKQLYEQLKEIVRMRKDIPERKLIFYDGERSMMKEYGISPLVHAAASPTVPLQTGGYIVIEHTEAMTVVDVNTGSYVGTDNLEETVFAVNMEAAKEIARQIRLRNIGGIVVIDFIDMLDEKHRLAVNDALGELLAQDKAKCHLLPMNEFCVSQFTRKRVGNDMHSFLVKPCNCCAGKGHVPDDIFVITRLRANILDCFADGYTSAIIELNENIMKKILNEGFFRVEAGARWKNKRIYFIPHKTYKEDFFTVRGERADVLVLPDNAQILY